MKILIVMTVLAASVATGASAMINSTVHLKEIQGYAPNADVSTLTDREISVLLNHIHGGDTEGEKREWVLNFMRKKNG